MKAYYDSGWNLNPTVGLSRNMDVMQESTGGENFFDYDSDADVLERAREIRENPIERMPVEQQQKIIDENGLTGKLTPDPTLGGRALEIIMDTKEEELHNAFVMERGQHGLLGMGASFVAGAL
ncbi:MAG: hypothetical protein K2H64_03230, partial [Desulfovibrio sp.]|nr:hypothetical protein [Desulfovibrio sp.]